MTTLRALLSGLILVLEAGCADEPHDAPLVNGSIDSFDDRDEISDQGNKWRVVAEVAEEWQEYAIPCDLFKQEGFGRPIEWDGRYASHIGFFPILGGSFRFAVDNVRFYRD